MNQFVQDKGVPGLSADERAKVWNLCYSCFKSMNVMVQFTYSVTVQFFKIHNKLIIYKYMENYMYEETY